MVGSVFRNFSEKVTPKVVSVVREVTLSQVFPLSVDLTMFPDLPTLPLILQNRGGSSLSGVVVVPEELELSFLEHEMTVKLKREIIIMSKIFSSVPQYHPSSVYHLQISNLTFA
jgi:hypothetical protein